MQLERRVKVKIHRKSGTRTDVSHIFLGPDAGGSKDRASFFFGDLSFNADIYRRDYPLDMREKLSFDVTTQSRFELKSYSWENTATNATQFVHVLPL